MTEADSPSIEFKNVFGVRYVIVKYCVKTFSQYSLMNVILCADCINPVICLPTF